MMGGQKTATLYSNISLTHIFFQKGSMKFLVCTTKCEQG